MDVIGPLMVDGVRLSRSCTLIIMQCVYDCVFAFERGCLCVCVFVCVCVCARARVRALLPVDTSGSVHQIAEFCSLVFCLKKKKKAQKHKFNQL